MEHQLNEEQKSMMRSVSKNIIGKFDLNPVPIYTGLHGEIFHITNQADNQSLILKVIWKNNQALYKNEKKIHYSLKNRYIVQLQNCFGDEINYYLVMEYCKHGNLRSALQAKLSIDLVKDYGLQLAKGIHYLHKNNIIHHDIKPENILITNNNQLKICDFGLAVQYQEGKSVKGCQGTLAYAPPEAIELHTQSFDVWSFGCVLYEMATGSLPFKFKSWKELGSTMNEKYLQDFNYNPRLPQSLVYLLKKIFVYDKKERISIDRIIKHSFFTGDPLQYSLKQEERPLVHKKRSMKGMTRSVQLKQSKDSQRHHKQSKDNKQNTDRCNYQPAKRVNAPNYKQILEKKFKKQSGVQEIRQESRQKNFASKTTVEQLKRQKFIGKLTTQVLTTNNIKEISQGQKRSPSPLDTLNMRIAPVRIKNTQLRIDREGITRQILSKEHPSQLINISCDGKIIKMKKGKNEKTFTLQTLPAKFYKEYEECKRILQQTQSEQPRVSYTDKNFMKNKTLKFDIMYDKKVRLSLQGQFELKEITPEQLLSNITNIKEEYYKQIKNIYLRLIEMHRLA